MINDLATTWRTVFRGVLDSTRYVLAHVWAVRVHVSTHFCFVFWASRASCYGIVLVPPAEAFCLILLRFFVYYFPHTPAVLALAFASSYASLSILRVLTYLIREILFSCGQAGLDISSIFEDQWHASSGSSFPKVEPDAER